MHPREVPPERVAFVMILIFRVRDIQGVIILNTAIHVYRSTIRFAERERGGEVKPVFLVHGVIESGVHVVV